MGSFDELESCGERFGAILDETRGSAFEIRNEFCGDSCGGMLLSQLVGWGVWGRVSGEFIERSSSVTWLRLGDFLCAERLVSVLVLSGVLGYLVLMSTGSDIFGGLLCSELIEQGIEGVSSMYSTDWLLHWLVSLKIKSSGLV